MICSSHSPCSDLDIYRHLTVCFNAGAPPGLRLKGLPVVSVFSNCGFLLSKHALYDSSRPAVCQSVLFQHQCVFQPDWAHKLNGFVRSIQWWLLWLGSCPEFNMLKGTISGIFLLGGICKCVFLYVISTNVFMFLTRFTNSMLFTLGTFVKRDEINSSLDFCWHYFISFFSPTISS